jgi:hypothetical protein
MLLTRLKLLGLALLLLAMVAGLATNSLATGPAGATPAPGGRPAAVSAPPALPPAKTTAPRRERKAVPPETGAVRLESDQVEALAFAPDSQLLAGGCMDHKVRLWDMRNNKLKATLDGPKGIIRRVAFSPDGKMLAASADDGVLYLWEVSTGKRTATLQDRPAFVNGLVFLPGGAGWPPPTTTTARTGTARVSAGSRSGTSRRTRPRHCTNRRAAPIAWRARRMACCWPPR